jgi:hypothetical protein
MLNRDKLLNLAEEQASNGGEPVIQASVPYIVDMTLEGSSPMLFHRYNTDEVEAKAKAPKGSKAKKVDNLESYVYRNADMEISIPGEYLRGSIINASKFQQDPRSPRKSAMDLFRAGIISLNDLSSLGITKWDYEDRRRAMVQRGAVTRTRPAIKAGWRADFQFMVQLSDYIDPVFLRRVIDDAGRLVGLGDMRPTFGRFVVVKWELSQP